MGLPGWPCHRVPKAGRARGLGMGQYWIIGVGTYSFNVALELPHPIVSPDWNYLVRLTKNQCCVIDNRSGILSFAVYQIKSAQYESRKHKYLWLLVQYWSILNQLRIQLPCHYYLLNRAWFVSDKYEAIKPPLHNKTLQVFILKALWVATTNRFN